jgi:hypothetical protein
MTVWAVGDFVIPAQSGDPATARATCDRGMDARLRGHDERAGPSNGSGKKSAEPFLHRRHDSL